RRTRAKCIAYRRIGNAGSGDRNCKSSHQVVEVLFTANEEKVRRTAKPTTKRRPARTRRQIVDAVLAASIDDAQRLAHDRNPLRPGQMFNLFELAMNDAMLQTAREVRAQRDAQIAEVAAIFQ
ncbi:MAG: hypothetical protein JNK57_20565, partial [Planctomycetaceae bacterium]|nr:hypothetical protein [Planctomycetaceae bacterium]